MAAGGDLPEPPPQSDEEEMHTFTSQPIHLTDETEMAAWGFSYADGNQEDFAYRVYSATPLVDAIHRKGDPAEYAVRDVAAACGLPDFVFDSKKVPKLGGGTEEPTGDGIIICGRQGVILQSKNRVGTPRGASKESRWLTKNIRIAYKQAHGCYRAIMASPLELTNYRGRKLVMDGRKIAWTIVIVVNHPDTPASFMPTLPEISGRPRAIVLTRRDWEFLYRHLWSNCAVITYLERVRCDQRALGEEPMRYGLCALQDLNPELQNDDNPERAKNFQPLPGDEVDLSDMEAHLTLWIIMEHVALACFEPHIPEVKRLSILAILDAIPVCYRTQLGEQILAKLAEAREGSISDQIKGIRVRWVFDGRPFAALFGVASEQSDEVEEVLAASTTRCHIEFKAEVDSSDVMTIGVMLVPERDSIRDWRTLLEIREG